MEKILPELSNEEYNQVMHEIDEEHRKRLVAEIYGEDGSPESRILDDMSIRNMVRKALLDKEDSRLIPSNSKSITVRLSFSDYSKLKVLSGVLDQSLSGLSKILLTDSISECLFACAEVKGEEWAAFDFKDQANEIEKDLHAEAMENT